MTEQEARAALRPLGFRLSQRNAGFVILDGSHRYVATGYEDGGRPEIPLAHVAAWLATTLAGAPDDTDRDGARLSDPTGNPPPGQANRQSAS